MSTATAPTMNAAAITRRIRAAGYYAVSHRDPQRPGHVRVVPVYTAAEEAATVAGSLAELLTGAGYVVEPIQMGSTPGDALTVSLPATTAEDDAAAIRALQHRVEHLPAEIAAETHARRLASLRRQLTEDTAALSRAVTNYGARLQEEAATVPTTTPRTVEDPRVTTDPAERAVLLDAAARLDALPTDDEPEDEWDAIEADVDANAHATIAAAAELATYRSTGGGAYELVEPATMAPAESDEAPTPRTVHVVNWTPQGVGGFEWRWNRDSAERVARDQRLFGTGPDRDETVQIHAVELPAEVGDDAEGITSWLDSEGWSDGGDPRTVHVVTVKVENTYQCGRESESVHELPAPPSNAGPWTPGELPTDVPGPADVLADWFDAVAREVTGDGHACGQSEDALHTVTIVAAPGRPELVGQSHEFGL